MIQLLEDLLNLDEGCMFGCLLFVVGPLAVGMLIFLFWR